MTTLNEQDAAILRGVVDRMGLVENRLTEVERRASKR